MTHFSHSSKQLELYDETFRPLVDSVLNGFNGTIFAYGQTGTGKTYTMEGNVSFFQKIYIFIFSAFICSPKNKVAINFI